MSDSRRFRIQRWQDGRCVERLDELAVEEPLEIRVGGEAFSVTMRTPGHDAELVAGFLLSEGVVLPPSVPLIRSHAANIVNVALSGLEAAKLSSMKRQTITSASCGICGKASIEAAHQRFAPIASDGRFTRAAIAQMWETVEHSQSTFSRTGGLHAAAIFDGQGNLIAAHEDVGRHNAVDKVIGNALLRKLLPLDSHVLLVSSRASFEIMQKALSARIPVVAVVSAPSSLAVDFAEASGQTLIGFLRPGRCNVYTHAERLA